MIITGLKIERGPKNFYHVVSEAWIILLENKLSKNFTPTLISIAQVHHHEQVGAGGHPAAVASHEVLNFIPIFLQNHQYRAFYILPTLKCKIFHILIITFLKILFASWNFFKNLLTRFWGPYTGSWIFPLLWQVSQNGLDTPYIGYMATTDSNLET